MLKRNGIIFISLLAVVMLSSCSASLEKAFTQDIVNDLYERAENSVNKYGDEPEPGSLAPFGSSLSITGKAVLIRLPVFEGMDAQFPFDVYEEYGLDSYSWYTGDPSDVQYVVLIDMFFSPDDENGSGDTIIFTIADLSYGEKIYRSFLTGSEGLPYKELADILEHLTLK